MNPTEDIARSGRLRGTVPSIADVAVVGGGIVGAAAALAAAQASLSVVWITGDATAEADPPADRDARVYAISPSTQRFLDRLRVWAQLDATRLAPVFDMRVFGDRDGHAALHFDAYQAATERLATIVEHRELARVLRTAAAFFPGIERIDGDAAQVVVDTDRATLTTATGPRSARLVVAADGARSAIRTTLGIATQGRPYDQRALVGNFAAARPHGGTAFQWFTDDGVIALLPLASSIAHPHAVSLVWSAPDALAAQSIAAGPDALAARLSSLVSGDVGLGALTAIGPLTAIPLAVQWADTLVAPRAVLVGDAAHVIHPLAGQGLNLGFGDVEALIDVLAARETFRDVGDRVLLRRYERRRSGPVHAMRTITDGLVRLFATERPWIAPARGLGMRLLDHAVPLKRLLVRQAAGGSPFD